MRRIACGLVVMFALSAGAIAGPRAAGDELVFMGTVEKLESAPLEQSNLDWVVRCRVDRIVSGEFSGKAFSFRVHSSSKSGLEVGK